MPDVDFARFGQDIKRALGNRSYAQAVAEYPWLNRGMLSRAVNGQKLSAASYLALCLAFDLDVWTAFSREKPMSAAAKVKCIKDILNHTVTADASRETEAAL